MANKYKRYKKSGGAKWAFIIIALLLLCTAIVGVCLQYFGSDKLKPSEWFKKSVEQTEETETRSGEELDGDLIVSDFSSTSLQKGVKLSASIESSSYPGDICVEDSDSIDELVGAQYFTARSVDYKVVNVTFEPATTTVKQVKYSASFIRPEDIGGNAWAYQNKNANDYIHVEIQSDGSTGHVYCDKPFGNPIRLTVSWLLDENISASCTCTYKQKISDSTVTWSENACNGLPLNGEVTLSYMLNLDEEYTTAFYKNGIDFTCRIITNDDFIDRMSYYGIYNIPASVKAVNIRILPKSITSLCNSVFQKHSQSILPFGSLYSAKIFSAIQRMFVDFAKC